jgi:hypothetical protein
MEIAERIMLVVGAILYFVPTVLAWWMHVKSARAIFYVNLVFGWTIVGLDCGADVGNGRTE